MPKSVNTPIAKFSLATNERFKNRSGEWQERVEWYSIVAWQRLAEIVGEFVATGSKVYIEGKLQTSNREDRQSGERRYRTEIVAREIVLLGSRVNGHEGKGEVQNLARSQRPQKPRTAFLSKTDEICGNLSTCGRATDRDGHTPPQAPSPRLSARPGARSWDINHVGS